MSQTTTPSCHNLEFGIKPRFVSILDPAPPYIQSSPNNLHLQTSESLSSVQRRETHISILGNVPSVHTTCQPDMYADKGTCLACPEQAFKDKSIRSKIKYFNVTLMEVSAPLLMDCAYLQKVESVSLVCTLAREHAWLVLTAVRHV